MKQVLPDMDFCLWKDFPFNQMIEIYIKWYGYDYFNYSRLKSTCLLYWLDRYKTNAMEEANNLSTPCDYDSFLKLCDKSEFQVKSSVWDWSDIKLVSKGIQIVLNVSIYFISLFGLVTNTILIYLIWNKTTRDIFKGLKHYQYLTIISIFNIIIILITIISWISDCKNTLDAFCPEIRKFLAIQFFKVITNSLIFFSFSFLI